jgi:hypothetical protein
MKTTNPTSYIQNFLLTFKSPFMKRKRPPVLIKKDMGLLMQLYELNKAEKRHEARLPEHDFRRQVIRKEKEPSVIQFATIRRALTKFAAIW